MTCQKNINAKRLTNFRAGGVLEYLIRVVNKSDLLKAIDFAKNKNKPIFIIGSGTNILISDKLQKSVFIKFENNEISLNKKILTSDAGAIWDDVVKLAVANNLQGIECLSGIPGTAGAAPVQNIGAYGQEIKESICEVEVFDLQENKFKTFLNKDCKFSYRDSVFKRQKGRYIVYSTKLMLSSPKTIKIDYDSLAKKINGKVFNLKTVRKMVLEIRKEKFGSLNGIGTAGSFFKNPIVSQTKFRGLIANYPEMPYFKNSENYKLYGGWLIEKSGWKGYKNKNVSVSSNNALVLQNHSKKANSQEIYDLANKIRLDVSKKFDIKLEPEVQLIGF